MSTMAWLFFGDGSLFLVRGLNENDSIKLAFIGPRISNIFRRKIMDLEAISESSSSQAWLVYRGLISNTLASSI